MGRYSSVQAYADNQSNTRTISYEQAKGSSTSDVKSGSVRPEKIVNPYGSTAGAGSGEFHVYRHARAREAERLQRLEEAEREERADAEFQHQLERNRAEAEERTCKRRKKRQRQKDAKRRKQNLEKLGIATGGKPSSDGENEDDDEFEYKGPIPVQKIEEGLEELQAPSEIDCDGLHPAPGSGEGTEASHVASANEGELASANKAAPGGEETIA